MLSIIEREIAAARRIAGDTGEPDMSQAFVTCPETDKPVYVGLNLEWSVLDWLQIGEQEIECPVCGHIHRWSKDDVVLRADGGGS